MARYRETGGEHFRAKGGETVEQLLAERMPDAARRTLKQLVEHGRVLVDGSPARRLDAVVRAGAAVRISPRGSGRTEAPPLPQGLHVVHMDEDIAVVEKPPGMLTIATEREKRRTAYAYLREHVKATDPSAKIFIVHRLDRDTSGLLVFAKTPEAKERLQADFAARRVDRVYVAAVHGLLERDEGTLTSYLLESEALKVHVTNDPSRGVEAVTRYRVVKRGRKFTIVDVSLVTGRKAQIRVQFAAEGHPVAGDRVYGDKNDMIGRLALHATRLAFTHPRTMRRVQFQSRVPREITRLAEEE